ncbi:MAG TPA: hypothetical protein PK124_02090, partial [Bacteroidales bacterium]|nr:hypothetical protein [Bacteroidales bacterium]
MKKIVIVIFFSFLFNAFLFGQEKNGVSELSWINKVETDAEKFYENGTRICYLNIYGEIPETYVQSIANQVLANSGVLRFHLYYGKEHSRCMCETKDDFTNEQLAIILDEIIDKYYDSGEYLIDNYDVIIKKVSNNGVYAKRGDSESQPPSDDDYEPTVTNYRAGSACPDYANTVSSSADHCAGQTYYFEVQNTDCNGDIYFDVVGNYGSSWANEITWEIVSSLTSNVVASGGPGVNGADIFSVVGPIDADIQGKVFYLYVYDSSGDGFNGTGGYITIEQSGTEISSS